LASGDQQAQIQPVAVVAVATGVTAAVAAAAAFAEGDKHVAEGVFGCLAMAQRREVALFAAEVLAAFYSGPYPGVAHHPAAAAAAHVDQETVDQLVSPAVLVATLLHPVLWPDPHSQLQPLLLLFAVIVAAAAAVADSAVFSVPSAEAPAGPRAFLLGYHSGPCAHIAPAQCTTMH
jgi:hypothetical protein